jgi:hypothetical protein
VSVLGEYIVICDGSFKKKIGSTTAFIIKDFEGNIVAKGTEFIKISNYRDPRNVLKCEMASIQFALKKLLELELNNENIQLWSDSTESINIINNDIDSTYLEGFDDLISQFTNIQFIKVQRNLVTAAHKLCYAVTIQKTLEKRFSRIQVDYKEGDIWLVKAPPNNIIYKVNLRKGSCNCIHGKKRIMCKHVRAARLKAPKIISEMLKDTFN